MAIFEMTEMLMFHYRCSLFVALLLQALFGYLEGYRNVVRQLAIHISPINFD